VGQNVTDTHRRRFLEIVPGFLFDEAVGRPEELRVEIPGSRDLRAGWDILIRDKTKVVFHIVRDERLHGHIRAT
jgi:hypothetical protein